MYNVRLLDAEGQLLSEKQIEAHSYAAVLRQLRDVVEGTQRIEVLNQQGEKAGGASVDFWRQSRRK